MRIARQTVGLTSALAPWLLGFICLAISANPAYSGARLSSGRHQRCRIIFTSSSTKPDTLFITTLNNVTDQQDPVASLVVRNGTSAVSFVCDRPEFVEALHGGSKIEAYVKPGDDVLIRWQPLDRERPLRFGGSEAVENNYLLEKDDYLRLHIPAFRPLYSLPAIRFDSLNESSLRDLRRLIALRLRKNHAFASEETLDVYSSWAVRKLLYPGYHKYFSGGKDSVPPGADISTLAPLDASYGSISRNYVELVNMYISHGVVSARIDTSKSIVSQQLADLRTQEKIIRTQLKSDKLKRLFIGRLMWEYLQLGFVRQFQQHLGNWLAGQGHDPSAWPPLQRFNALKALDSGKMAPNFTYKDLAGREHRFSGLKGKFVFVNVWSLDCRYSLDENTSIAALRNAVTDTSSVVFLNINDDKDADGLKAYLNSHTLPGLNATCGGIGSAFNTSYFITTTPRYILIDKKGQVVYSFADRPSSPTLAATLNRIVANK